MKPEMGNGKLQRQGTFCLCVEVMILCMGMFSIYCAASVKARSISPVAAQFVQDVMPEMENLRWPLGGQYLVVVRNRRETSVRIKDITLNGASVVKGLKREEHFSNIWFGEDQSKPSETVQKLVNAGEPIWYKVSPNSIPAGRLGYILVKTRTVPDKTVEVGIADSQGDMYVTSVAPKQSKIRLAYVGFGPNCEKLVIFARKFVPEALTLDKVYLDEVDITKRCNIVSENFWKELGIVTASLENSLREGSYHLLRITTKQGVETIDTVRVRKDFYWVGLYGWSTKGETAIERTLDFYRMLNANYFNTSVPMTPDLGARFFRTTRYGLELARQADIMLQYAFNYGDPIEPTDRLLAWNLWDEIDLHDGVNVKSLPERQRLGSTAQDRVIELMQGKQKENPAAFSWIQLDGWGQPHNYFVYARAVDIPSGGDYYAGQAKKQPISVYDAVNALRWAAMPGVFNSLIYCNHEVSFGYPRFPTPQEEKIMAYYGVAAGAKGQCYYSYGGVYGEDRNVAQNPSLLATIGGINHTLQTLSPLLLQSYPAEGIITQATVNGQNDSNLWYRTLLCTDGKVSLVLVNRNFVSDTSGFTYTPLQNVQITLKSPPWLTLRWAMLVDSSGVFNLKDLSNPDASGRVTLSLSSLDIADIIVLSSSSKTGKRLRTRFAEITEQSAQRVASLSSLLASETRRLEQRKQDLLEQGILLDSGFEMAKGDDMGDWEPHSGYWDTSEKHSGEYSLAVRGSKGQFSTGVPVVEGKKYYLEFFVKFSKVSPDEVLDGTLQFMKKTGGLSGPVARVKGIQPGWHKAGCEGKAGKGTVAARIVFEKRSGTEVVWVDDVKLIEVRE